MGQNPCQSDRRAHDSKTFCFSEHHGHRTAAHTKIRRERSLAMGELPFTSVLDSMLSPGALRVSLCTLVPVVGRTVRFTCSLPLAKRRQARLTELGWLQAEQAVRQQDGESLLAFKTLSAPTMTNPKHLV